MKKIEKNNDISIFKPNELIEVIDRPISVIGLKAYNYILKKLQENKTSNMIIPPSEILLNIGTSDSYEELYNYLDELQKTQVKSIDKRGKLWGSFVLLSAFKKSENGLYLEIPQIIAKELLKDNNLYYTTIKLLEEKSFKCSYSIIFYEIFKKYEKVELPIYTLKELKKLTKTENKYKTYYDFKRRVLIPAIKEINNFNKNFEYSFNEVYLGRKVDSIQFTRENKDKDIIDAEIVEDTSMSEKLLNAIKKAKKSLYVQSAYSQKAMEKLLKKYDEKLIIKALKELANYNQEIKSFSAIMTAKIEDIKNSSNEAIEKKLDEVVIPPKKRKKKITEDNMSDIFEIDENIEKLKKLLSKQAKEQGKFNEMSSSLINACKTREDIEMVANNLKLEVNLELF